MGFYDFLRALQREGFWGPFLVLSGIFLLYTASTRASNAPLIQDYALLIGAGIVTLAGVILMFRQIGANDAVSITGMEDGQEDATYVVRQLSRNFEVLRAQTNQGFLLSGIFMSIGLLVIVVSLFAPTFGIKTTGVDSFGVMAGVVTEFISATALLLYKLNFTRLNETSDRLDNSWRVLAAFKLTHELPEDKKAEATLQLITTLTKSGA